MAATLQQDRCTQNDYVRLFADSAESLKWLCYTLMDDKELSDKVLNAALEQCLRGAERVFRDWMVSWARRLIIKACAEILHPGTSAVACEAYPLLPMRLDAANRIHLDQVLSLPSDLLQERLLELEPLCRFVFVLRVLEGYSRRETSLLLNIDDRVCEWVYVRAAGRLIANVKPLEWETRLMPLADFCLAQAGD